MDPAAAASNFLAPRTGSRWRFTPDLPPIFQRLPIFTPMDVIGRRASVNIRGHLILRLNEQFSGVTVTTTNNVFDQLKAMAMVAATRVPPCWLRKSEHDWPASEIIAAKNGLVHVGKLREGSVDAIRPGTPRFFTHWPGPLSSRRNRCAPPPSRWLRAIERVLARRPAEHRHSAGNLRVHRLRRYLDAKNLRTDWPAARWQGGYRSRAEDLAGGVEQLCWPHAV